MVAADKMLDEMSANQAKLSFEADALSLARDAAQLAALRKEVEGSERLERLAKVQHLRSENKIGSAVISDFMFKRCRHTGGPLLDLNQEVLKAHGACSGSRSLSL